MVCLINSLLGTWAGPLPWPKLLGTSVGGVRRSASSTQSRAKNDAKELLDPERLEKWPGTSLSVDRARGKEN